MIFEEDMAVYLESCGQDVYTEDFRIKHDEVERLAVEMGYVWNEVLEVWKKEQEEMVYVR